MNPAPHPLSYERRAYVARLLNQAQASLVNALDEALAPYDISAAQYVILSTLASGRGETAAAICKDISYSPGAMTRMINRLVDKELVLRAEHPDNRRKNRLQLSSKGHALFPLVFAAASQVIDRHLSSFNGTQLQQLQEMLEQMLGRD